ncbi:MAG: large subunit ribosomal protein [Variibacter sp.]|jgi:large subunit ribosomal protein L21|nr:large subunit ribosomal protein [Variibacter sp.]
MFAVIRTGGKQYRVVAEDVIKIDKIAGSQGEIVQITDVLMVGGDQPTLGTPVVAGATVAAEVVEQGRGATIIAFKKRRRQNSRRKRGIRQEFTRLRITEILTDGKKPTLEARRKVPDATPPQTAAETAPQTAAETAAEAPSAEAKPKRTRAKADKAEKDSTEK